MTDYDIVGTPFTIASIIHLGDGQSSKQETMYTIPFDTGKALRQGLAGWIQYYNLVRGHSSLDDKTSDEVYYGLPRPFCEAA